MKLPFLQITKQYVLQFADLYHKYKIETDRLQKTRYAIHSSLSYFKSTGLIQLSYTDKPGDLLPPLSLAEIKNTPDLIAGLHPVDVNSINDLYYLSQDKILKLIIDDEKIQAVTANGQLHEYDINQSFDHENSLSKRVSFLIGYIQAEKFVKRSIDVKEKYKIIRDNISSLTIMDVETQEEIIRNPLDILFSEEYKQFSKEDIGKIGHICGQMSRL